MKIYQDYPLRKKTSYQIGGPAKYFCLLEKESDLEKFFTFQEKLSLPIFILAGGSNLLISDNGFPGIVLQPSFTKIKQLDKLTFQLSADLLVSDLVKMFNDQGLIGLENAGGLPGSLGGAIRGNAGCFGFEIKDLVVSVKAINLQTQEIRSFSKEECQFQYRSSFFKTNPEWLIVEIILRAKGFQEPAKLWQITEERINYRKEKHPLEYPNAGSVFKNIPFEKANKYVQNLALEKKKVKNDPFPIIPTAFLIDEAGLKGKTIGRAKISEKHSNFIVNLGSATFRDVYQLIDYVQKTLEDKFEVLVEPEILILLN